MSIENIEKIHEHNKKETSRVKQKRNRRLGATLLLTATLAQAAQELPKATPDAVVLPASGTDEANKGIESGKYITMHIGDTVVVEGKKEILNNVAEVAQVNTHNGAYEQALVVQDSLAKQVKEYGESTGQELELGELPNGTPLVVMNYENKPPEVLPG